MNIFARSFAHLRGGNRETEASAIALAVGAKAAKAKPAEEPEDDEDGEDSDPGMASADDDNDDAAAKKAKEKTAKAKKAKEEKARKAKEAKDAAKDGDPDDDGDDDSDDPDDDDDDGEKDKEDMKKKATADARHRERARCASIFASVHAAGRPEVAAALAFDTDMSAKAAIGAMAKMGPVAQPKSGLREAMRTVERPNLGAGGGRPADANSPQAIAAGWDSAMKATGAR